MSDDFDAIFQHPKGAWAQRVADPRPAPEEAESAATVDAPYRAYGFTPADDLDTCDIGWWLTGDVPQGQAIQYRFLVRVGYIGDDQIHLMLTDAIIAIEGKHLHDLRKRLARGRVTFVQAFNPKIWSAPAEGEPVVTKVSVLYPGEAGFAGRS
jgi:hypothetical protein